VAVLTAILTEITHRAEMLIPMLVLGFFVGEFAAQVAGINAAFSWVSSTATRLVTKLNRPNRSVATRLYRGMVAMGMLVVPAAIAGVLLNSIAPLMVALMIALFGRAFATHRLLKHYRRARDNRLALELPEHDFLFADSHAVLRYAVLTSAESFAVGIVGTCFWYLIGGLPLALAYLVLAEVAVAHAMPVFGWAATSLFSLMNAIPHLLTRVFLTFAGIFVPRATPFTARRAKRFHGFLALLLNVALGGTLPGRDLPWEGTGTPKLLPEHFARWLLVRLAATILLLFTLASPNIVKLLNTII
jgi:cobalamin biosynthesis protein CobD/CbiB